MCRVPFLVVVLLLGAACSSGSKSSTPTTLATTTTTLPPRLTSTVSHESIVDPSFRQGIARNGDGWIFSLNDGLFRTDGAFKIVQRKTPGIPSRWAAQGYTTSATSTWSTAFSTRPRTRKLRTRHPSDGHLRRQHAEVSRRRRNPDPSQFVRDR